MPVPTSRSDLSITPSSNSPSGAEAVFPNLDNYLRAGFAFAAQNFADVAALTAVVAAILPAGLITMWSGASADIPNGWTLCDGSSGTPDLRDRFVIGAGGTRAPGATGGAVSAVSDSQGAHTHTIAGGVTDGHVLTLAEIPSHKHISYYGEAASYPNGQTGTGKHGSNASDNDNVWPYTSSEGGDGSHSHGLSTLTTTSAGTHAHTVATVPPFFALCFIMKTA